MSISRLIAGQNHNVLTLNGLKNGLDQQFVNNATVSVEIDQNGSQISGMSWPATMIYQPDSLGNYQLLLSPNLNLIAGQYYQIKISAQADNLTADWDYQIKATSR